jgi:hypothetical protein
MARRINGEKIMDTLLTEREASARAALAELRESFPGAVYVRTSANPGPWSDEDWHVFEVGDVEFTRTPGAWMASVSLAGKHGAGGSTCHAATPSAALAKVQAALVDASERVRSVLAGVVV